MTAHSLIQITKSYSLHTVYHNAVMIKMIPENEKLFINPLKAKVFSTIPRFVDHPKLSKLLEILTKHFTDCDDQTRAMVFSSYRDRYEKYVS